MRIDVLTPAPVTQFLDIGSLKARLGIEDATEDSLLAEYAEEACSALREEGFFARELARQEYREVFYPEAGYSGPIYRSTAGGIQSHAGELVLSCNPIDPDSVSVVVNGVTLTQGEDYEVRSALAGLLYRPWGWQAFSGLLNGGIEVTYKGGFLIPASAPAAGVVTTWAASTAYPVGAWVRPASGVSVLRFECTTAGTSGSAGPTWPSVAGTAVADGTAVWTARRAWELPPTIRQLASIAVKELRSSASREAGLIGSTSDGGGETYAAASATSTGFSPELTARLQTIAARYRR